MAVAVRLVLPCSPRPASHPPDAQSCYLGLWGPSCWVEPDGWGLGWTLKQTLMAYSPVLRTLARLKPSMTLEEGLWRAVQEWQHKSNFDRMIYYEMARK